ncbi:hypothetical protein JOB18_021322 [Solea senegalensis]|uniref:Uncharacterized protein n=1 Tax=Solea senegalensis TaxID=28829 RepID=A0AAV6RHS0_SOLSE|nr:golgin subfamily A member 4-like isoform X3 [Solea senegalensis]KAG7505016.1 hypothetical protein JOB18_021322 [Solea senegalensis]
MMSKTPRFLESQANSKTNASTQGRGAKDQLTVPLSTGGKHAGSTTSKSSVSCGRSNNQSAPASVSKVGGSLKRSSLSHQTTVGHRGSRHGSRTGKPSFRLCGSRSFSSLHTTSLTAAPFIRSSRSLSRLDQRPTGQESHNAVPGSKVKGGQTSGKKMQESTSEEQIRDNKDQCRVDVEKMKTSCSSELPESSSSPLTATYHQCNKVKTEDDAYTLCAMTSGVMRHNWVQALLKNVKPSLTPEVTTTLSAQTAHQQAEFGLKCENDCMQEHRTGDLAEDSHQQEDKLKSEKGQRSADDSSPLPPISPPLQVEDDHCPSCHQCPLLVETSQTDLGSESLVIPECVTERETLPCEDQQQTAQLVKELEQTLRELSRLEQLNRNLQDELQREKERQSVHPQNERSNSSEQALTLQRLQKINTDLHLELEAQKRSQEETREAELQRRADLLAQQAQLLVTGDATALAQAHLEQDRQRFCEQQMKWEHSVSSLRSQLSTSEERRREAESRLTQLQQEMQSFYSLQLEAEQLQKHLHEVKTKLCSNEEAQAEKEARLQKHLMLLQASQDRERRSLASSLEQAEQHSQELQERLDHAEQQMESLSKSQTWTKEIEEVQQQLQEELSRTVSAVQKLQEEREQLDQRCQELQGQLSEADGEVSRLQSRLKTDETQYYNLEHSYERVCEELQVALGKVQQREADMQDIREGYERLLDRKEEELSEVLLKMEVLGNSLEETEVKLNEVLKDYNCASSQTRVELSEPPHVDRQQEITTHLTLNDRRQEAIDSGQTAISSNTTDIVQINGNHSDEHMRNRSRSIDPSYQCVITAGDEPERFLSVIQLLESKLYETEEKLKDITQRLEDHQSHISFQDPHLYSQLTQCRATAQHLSLLLHSQVKQSQRFAQETENRCRMLVGRFHVALNIIQACRERLHATPINVAHFEKQLATAAACLQQGEDDAQKQQHESYNASKGEDKIPNDETLAGAHGGISAKSKTSTSEDDITSVRKHLKRELFVVEKMLTVLQNQHGIVQLSLVARGDEVNVAHRYKSLISQRLALKAEHSRTAEYNSNEPLESAFGRFCAEGELIYAALKFQRQHESLTQVNYPQGEHQKKGLADINPPELAPYQEQVMVEGRVPEEATKPDKREQLQEKKVEAEKQPEWMERLISRLKRRRKFLNQLCQETCEESVGESSMDSSRENDSQLDMNWMQEQVKLTYLSDRLHLDLEQELQQSELLQNKLQDLFKKRDTTLLNERAAFNHTLCQLEEVNSVLREELEQAEQKIISAEIGNQRLLEDIQKIQDYHEERMQKLEAKFQDKIQELQQIHEDEMKHLHGYYTKEKQSKSCTEVPVFSESNSSSEQTAWMGGGDGLEVRAAGQKQLQKPENHSVSAMEEVHRKLIGELLQQHQVEVAALQKEKDQLLQQETAATLAAIVAMRRAHKQELEKSRQSQQVRERGDVTQLHTEYKTEIQSLHKELEVLSVQHTQKCLENSQLSQELQDERRSLAQYQKENQELKEKQRETDEMCELQFPLNGKQSHVNAHPNDFYEVEVILRARDAEIQFLRQEACSLREELKIARKDKLYAQNKLKALCMHNQDEPHHHINNLSDSVKFATWSPGRDASAQSLKDSMTNTSDAAFQKKTEQLPLPCKKRGGRSKSLKDGLSAQERMKLFESF